MKSSVSAIRPPAASQEVIVLDRDLHGVHGDTSAG
jgi:hypothetical protein